MAGARNRPAQRDQETGTGPTPPVDAGQADTATAGSPAGAEPTGPLAESAERADATPDAVPGTAVTGSAAKPTAADSTAADSAAADSAAADSAAADSAAADSAAADDVAAADSAAAPADSAAADSDSADSAATPDAAHGTVVTGSAAKPAAADPSDSTPADSTDTDPTDTDPTDTDTDPADFTGIDESAGARARADAVPAGGVWTAPPAVDLGLDTGDPGSGEPAGAPRPAGKRRAAGTARPADLTAAEAEAGAAARTVDPAAPAPRRAANRYAIAGVLIVLAVVLAGLAVWFRGEADTLASGDVNRALTDSATTSEVIGQLTTAIEDTFSYNYTDLAGTERAVDARLTGKARCEYDQLFGKVQELAPEQRIIMATAVRSIGLVRLDGDRAEALVFIDQSSTRVDTNSSVAGEAQFGVLAHRDGDTWKITEFNMFDQPLVNGQPAPKC